MKTPLLHPPIAFSRAIPEKNAIKTAFFLRKSLEVQQKAVPLQPQNGTIPFFFEILVTNLRK